MRRHRFLAALAAMLLTLSLTASALAGSLTDAWDSGLSLLLDTDNVTITGTASFTIDGRLFKIARVRYVQADYDSDYELRLYTLRDGDDVGEQYWQETGWHVIANRDENDIGYIWAKEFYEPERWRTGTDDLHNTPVRRTTRLESLLRMANLLLGEMEKTLPAEALTVTEDENGKSLHINLWAEDVPDIANSALTLAIPYAAARFLDGREESGFARGSDQAISEYSLYVTDADEILEGTVAFRLRGADLTVTTDRENRFTGLSGSFSLGALNGENVDRTVGVRLELKAENYGESTVAAFDEDTYAYEPAQPPQEWQTSLNGVVWRALDTLVECGYEPERSAVVTEEDAEGLHWVKIGNTGSGDRFRVAYTPRGTMAALCHEGPWQDLQPEKTGDVDQDTLARATDTADQFLLRTDFWIWIMVDELKNEGVIRTEDGRLYLLLGAEEAGVHFVVQAGPEMRVESYTFDGEPAAADG
ncbi:MAG: hypothetical protein IKH77_09250 [Clostridia bacterium]|nr:hypothetical protein [Clostridia bacterium]